MSAVRRPVRHVPLVPVGEEILCGRARMSKMVTYWNHGTLRGADASEHCVRSADTAERTGNAGPRP